MQTCKPGSVSPVNRDFYHLSGMIVTDHLYQPTLRHRTGILILVCTGSCRFIWSFNPRGLPSATVTDGSDELLPHPFTLTLTIACKGGLVSVALSVSSMAG